MLLGERAEKKRPLSSSLPVSSPLLSPAPRRSPFPTSGRPPAPSPDNQKAPPARRPGRFSTDDGWPRPFYGGGPDPRGLPSDAGGGALQLPLLRGRRPGRSGGRRGGRARRLAARGPGAAPPGAGPPVRSLRLGPGPRLLRAKGAPADSRRPAEPVLAAEAWPRERSAGPARSWRRPRRTIRYRPRGAGGRDTPSGPPGSPRGWEAALTGLQASRPLRWEGATEGGAGTPGKTLVLWSEPHPTPGSPAPVHFPSSRSLPLKEDSWRDDGWT